MSEAPELKRHVARVMREVHQNFLTIEADDDKRANNPNSMVFERGLRWRYWSLKLATREKRFCYSTRPNCTGFYLSWIETRTSKRAVTTCINPHELRREARAFAQKQYNAAKAERVPPCK